MQAAVAPDASAVPARIADQTTAERVLLASEELFNLHGIDAVSIQQISDMMGISSGNLTYHFKKKSDLILAHVHQFEHELALIGHRITNSENIEIATQGMVEGIALTNRFRFLFIGANFILQNNLISNVKYGLLINKVITVFVFQVRRLTAAGLMTRMRRPFTPQMLVEAVWYAWLGQLLTLQMVPPAERLSERLLLADMLARFLLICHPFMRLDFVEALKSEIRSLRATKAPRGAAAPA